MMTEQPPKDSPPLASSDAGPVQMDGAAAAQNRLTASLVGAEPAECISPSDMQRCPRNG